MHVPRNRLGHGLKPYPVLLSGLIKLACLLITTSWLLVGGRVEAVEKPNALEKYVTAKDGSYKWTLEATDQTDRGRMHRLKLVSQTWQGITWQHRLLVLEPVRLAHEHQVLLFITGGSTGREPSSGDLARYGELARYCAARVAVL